MEITMTRREGFLEIYDWQCAGVAGTVAFIKDSVQPRHTKKVQGKYEASHKFYCVRSATPQDAIRRLIDFLTVNHKIQPAA